ncbi:hypothetical protein [Flavobacterium sp. MK4S-17]|uniref:hypothetical protein n=1 Tax=Flavobacterium sp. MK4S-17 TaxID=2543737 RepID=UPI00135BFD9B|nr:hypothetical protein [Flavobacterium sp. MK4S-17]
MKNTSTFKTAVTLIALMPLLYACNEESKQEKWEQREKAKVGRVYNPDVQGIAHENRENQFPESRNDNEKGEGLETGAPSDTTALKDNKPLN